MNIEAKSQITSSTPVSTTRATSAVQTDESSAKFADELKSLKKSETEETEETAKAEKLTEEKSAIEESSLTEEEANKPAEDKTDKRVEEKGDLKTEKAEQADENKESDKNLNDKSSDSEKKEDNEDKGLESIYDGLQNMVNEINNKLNPNENQAESGNDFKKDENFIPTKPPINNKEENTLINNDMNIQDVKEQQLTPQMNLNMNFNTGEQPFSNFMNNEKAEMKLSINEADLKEEREILSTMNENIAIANRNMMLSEQNQQEDEKQIKSDTKTVINAEGVKRVDTKTNITVETVVKYDNVIMDKSDVDFFVNLVEKGAAEVNAKNIQSAKVSQTLADLIAKSMKDNQPVRIDFDNNISVIIKVGREGKISADFLPSSQVAEAYLKENLPLLRQKFDESNIEYDELNQRKQKQDEKDNQKKGRKDE